MENKWEKLVESFEGSEGTPGDNYTYIKAVLYQKGPRFRVKVTASSGSNQGYCEEHDGVELEGRGDDVEEAIGSVYNDVENLEYLEASERHQLLRTLYYEYEDLEVRNQK